MLFYGLAKLLCICSNYSTDMKIAQYVEFGEFGHNDDIQGDNRAKVPVSMRRFFYGGSGAPWRLQCVPSRFSKTKN
jgi:hypothetical protein